MLKLPCVIRVNLGRIKKDEAQHRARELAVVAYRLFRKFEGYLMANPELVVDQEEMRDAFYDQLQKDLTWCLPVAAAIAAADPAAPYTAEKAASDTVMGLKMLSLMRLVGHHPLEPSVVGKAIEQYDYKEPFEKWLIRQGKTEPEKGGDSRLDEIHSMLQNLVKTEKASKPDVPLFSQAAEQYIAEMIRTHDHDYHEATYIRHRKDVFIQICGDKKCDAYTKHEFEHFIELISYLPPNASKQSGFKITEITKIIAENKGAGGRRLSRKTLLHKYISQIRTILRSGCQSVAVTFPLQIGNIKIPSHVRRSTIKFVASSAGLSKVFRIGVESGILSDAMLPLLGLLTGRRLGLLSNMRGEDIHSVYGCWIVAPQSHVLEIDGMKRIPVKTNGSMVGYVLPRFLSEIGFVDWARQRDGFIFRVLQQAKDPADTASKRIGRIFRAAGLDPSLFKTFHGFRHMKADDIRDAKMEDRTGRIALGHDLDVHAGYGSLRESEVKQIAEMPLPNEIDLSMYMGLDFDAMAAKKPIPGARLYIPKQQKPSEI